jgi:hypothetical protein
MDFVATIQRCYTMLYGLGERKVSLKRQRNTISEWRRQFRVVVFMRSV